MKQYTITDRYIITEEQLQKFFWDESDDDIHIIKEIRSHPYNPQAEQEKYCTSIKCPNCGTPTWIQLADGHQTIFCYSASCHWKQQICAKAELRQGKDGET